MTIALAGFVAFFHFVFYPNYLRWLDLRKYKKLGLVMPKVAGYIECEPCKITAITDPGVYLRGECAADIPTQTGELIPIQPTDGKQDGLFFLDQLLFAIILTLVLFTIKALAKTTFTLLWDLFQEILERKTSRALDGLKIFKHAGKDSEIYNKRYELRCLEILGCFKEKPAKPSLFKLRV